jgi:guanine nucleotide exchange factor VAV
LEVDCLNINEISNGLRDGLVLCNLLKHISSLDHSSEINWRAKGRVACLKNIRMFLENCKKEFNLTDEDLFQADMLYDLNMECIFNALSKISRIDSVEKKCGYKGFNVNENELSDIYENIQVNNDVGDCYTDVNDIVGDHDGMYENIMNIKLTKNEERLNTANVNLSSKDSTIKEIFESETKFVNTLMIIYNDFMIHLMPILNDTDKKLVFINIESIKDLHIELLKQLRCALEGFEGRSNRICDVFDSFQFKIIQTYVDYFGGIHKSMLKIDSLISSDREFTAKLEWCQSHSSMGIFKLFDLIRLPYQRVLKYHLLFLNLNKYTKDDHPAKKNIQKTLSNMLDLSKYLNEAQRQNEILDQMNILNGQLEGFNFKTTTLKDFGELIKNDKVQIKEEYVDNFAKTRTILLLNKVLFICKSRGDKLVYKGTIMLNDFKIEEKKNASKISSSQINLVSTDRLKVCSPKSIFFKDVRQKDDWKNSLEKAIDILKPKGFNNKKHRFILYNFKRDIVNCSICKCILFGVFYQGYKCINCGCISHKKCIEKFDNECITESIDLNPTIPQQQHEIESDRLTKFVSFTVRAVHSYHGKPLPTNKEYSILKLNVGEIIQVTDDDDDDWWKGYKICDVQDEGYFPSNKVQAIKTYEPQEKVILRNIDYEVRNQNSAEPENKQKKSETLIKNESWFFNCDARASVKVLNNTKNSTGKTIFLVRPSQEGGYTISIKHKSQINHLRILSTSSKKLTLDKKIEFSTVQELIDYYIKNKLDYFPQLDTTLGSPFTNTSALDINSIQEIENENWYTNQKREIAIKILNGLNEEKDKSVFLVRPSQSGGYAVSIKFKSEIKNIQIITSNEPQKFYIDESLQFHSVKELVLHYIENSLEDVYPELPTKLEVPFRNLLPPPIETRKARFDYHPIMDTELEIKKDHFYSIISKNEDMWRLYNSDGLIACAPATCF